MAQEEIKLVGVFRDEITPKLKKLNKEINAVTRSFGRMRQKLQPIARDFEKIGVAVDRVGQGLNRQNAELRVATTTMSKYRTQVRRTAAEQRKLKPMRGGGMGGARGGGARGGGARGGGGGIGTAMALGGVGYQLSSMVTSGIVKGFEIGTNLLQMPFKFFMNGLGERISDEMSDIKAAGGIYAISKRMDDPLVRSFSEAETLTKETNRYLAELAGALPGDTQQYIQVAKQISDSIGQIISNDKEASIKIGKDLAAARGEDTSRFEGGGQVALQAAFKEMTGELTKQTVLASGGSAMGAMGLPQLTERMISSDNLTTGMFRRYGAVFRDPQIMSALERNIEDINKTAKSSGDRYKAIQKMYEEVVTPEYVRRVQRSTEGVMEAMRTTFMNPEVGLLGLGRPIELAGKASEGLSIKFDHFGRMLDKNNEVTTDVTKAVRDSLSLFDYLRDIFANVMIVMQPLLDVITSLYDPFEALARELDGLRKATMAFQLSFEDANEMLNRAAKDLTGDALKGFKATKGLRAALMAMTKGFFKLGAITENDAIKQVEKLLSSDTSVGDMGNMVMDLFDKLMNSVAGFKIGNKIGGVIGAVLKTFADLIVGIFGDKTVQNQLVKGFVSGFNKAGGAKAIKDIFNLVFDKIKDLIVAAVTTFPKEAAMLGGLAFAPMLLPMLPGMISSILSAAGPSIGAAIAGGLGAILASPALIAAVVAGLAITAKATEGPRKALTESLASSAQRRTDSVRGDDGQLRSLQGNGLAGIMDGLMGELTWVVHDFIKGFGDIFTGLYNIVVGAFTDPKMVGEGITQIMTGLFSLFTMIGHALIAIGYAVPGLIMAVLIAIKNLFVGIGHAIIGAWMGNDWTNKLGNDIRYLFNSMGQAIMNAATAVGDWGSRLATSIGDFFGNMMNAIGNAARSIPFVGSLIPGGDKNTGGAYAGDTSARMSLGNAIATENRMKPPGSHLVIANSSETVTPAYKGYAPNLNAMARPAFAGSTGGSGVDIGGITVNVTGGGNDEGLAEKVAQEIVYAIQKSTYNELYTS